jgi:hypothetical protein
MDDLHWCLRRLEKTPTFAEVAFTWKVAAH